MIKSKPLIFFIFFVSAFVSVFLFLFFVLIYGFIINGFEGKFYDVFFGVLLLSFPGGILFMLPCVLTCLVFIKTRNSYEKSMHEKICAIVGFLSCLIWSYIFGFEKSENIILNPLVLGVVGAITAFVVAKILNRSEK